MRRLDEAAHRTPYDWGGSGGADGVGSRVYLEIEH